MILTHFNQLVSTSGAEFACALRLTGRDTYNVATTANNTLKIYDVNVSEQQQTGDDGEIITAVREMQLNKDSAQFPQPSAKLSLKREYHLHGEIIGIQSIRIISSLDDGLDRLLLSFRDAKVGLLSSSLPISNALGDRFARMVQRHQRSPYRVYTYLRAIAASSMYNALHSHSINSATQLSQDMTRFKANLQSDPDNRCSALLLPDDSLALLSVHGTQADLDDLDEQVSKYVHLNSLHTTPDTLPELSRMSRMPHHSSSPSNQSIRTCATS